MNSAAHHRRSIRLDGYDYTQSGAYFVTIVTAGRAAQFGMVAYGEMRLNLVGQMAQREWQCLPGRFAGLVVDAFVIMPNHIHGILILCPPGEMDGAAVDDEREIHWDNQPHVAPRSLGAIVRAFKSATTLRYHRTRGADPGPLWQRNYYEHIVRGAADLEHVRDYILTNPTQWELDRENPDRKNG